jgi:peptide/nickel transport system permease protein
VLSRVIWGARASLLAGVISVGIALAHRRAARPAGGLSRRLGRRADQRITDAMLACPFLILAIALAAFLGPSLTNAMIAIGVTATPIFVRLTRGQVMSVKVEDYVEAARAVGNPRWRIALFPHPAEHHAGAAGAGDAVDRGRDHRRGEPVVPRLGQQPPAPSLGQHAQHRARTSSTTRRGWRSGRACDLPAPCCRSTCSATACATRSIRGVG